MKKLVTNKRLLRVLPIVTMMLSGMPVIAQSTLNGQRIQAGTLPISKIAATGTPSSATFLRGDGTWSIGGSDHKVGLNASDSSPDYLDAKVGVTAPLTATDTGGVRILGMGAAAAGVNGYLLGSDWTTFNGKEPGLGTPSATGYVLSSTTAGVRSWIAPPSGFTPAAVSAPGSVTGAITDYSGSTAFVTFQALFSADVSGEAGGNVKWQYSSDGSAWKGPDATSATYYYTKGGTWHCPVFFSTGSLYARAYNVNASGSASGAVTSAAVAYTAPPASSSSTGTVNIVTALPTPSASTQGGLYLVKGNGSNQDKLYCGIQNSPSIYQMALVSFSSFISAPLDPGSVSGLVEWLKADAITGLSDGAGVASWSDSSSSGNTATQATPANQPLYKVSVVNGKPIVRFNGSSQRIAAASSTSLNVTGPFTIFAVVKLGATLTGGQLVSIISKYDGSGNYGGYNLSMNGPNDIDFGWNTSGGSNYTVSSSSVGLPVGSYALVEGKWDGTTATLKLNGTQIGSLATTTGPGSNTKALFLGAFGTYTPAADPGRYFNGDIAEFNLYNAAVTASQEAGLNAYYSQKYNLGF